MSNIPRIATRFVEAAAVDSTVAKAYADQWSEAFQWAQASKTRNLRFRSTKWMSVPQVSATMSMVCPEYNAYNTEQVMRWLDMFKNIAIQIAREYSVCLYIKGPEDQLKLMAQTAQLAVGADEASVEPNGELRLWWD